MNEYYNSETFKIINDFLPDKIFDAHMHTSHDNYSSVPENRKSVDLDAYLRDMQSVFGKRDITCNIIPFPYDELKCETEQERSREFLISQLNKNKLNIGEIMVMPGYGADDIKKRIDNPQIKGLKCYWKYSCTDAKDQSDVEDYLPESAWAVADENNMFITLHLVKDRSLSDKCNLDYIKNMAGRYKNAKLILAHCARAFAPWTVLDTVDELAGFENVFFDFSAVCEPTPMEYIIKKVGVDRCMWGSDYPVCRFKGKAVSVADKFVWLRENDISALTKNTVDSWNILTENILAVYMAARLLDPPRSDIEKLFYNNAVDILKR